MDNKIKILFLAANPVDTDSLQLEEEYRAIKQKISERECYDKFDLVQEWAVRTGELIEKLMEHKPHIVHFSGHGSPTGEIIFKDNVGNARPVTTDALKSVFTVLKDNVRFVVLNACNTLPQAKAIAENIDLAVGMNTPIGDPAAIEFAAMLYSALCWGRSVGSAFEVGKTQLKVLGIPEEDTPELLSRVGVNPSEVYIPNREEVGKSNTSAEEDLIKTLYKDMVQLYIEAKDFLKNLQAGMRGFEREKLLSESTTVHKVFFDFDKHIRDAQVAQLLENLPERYDIEEIREKFSESFVPLSPDVIGRDRILEIDRRLKLFKEAIKYFETEVKEGQLDPALLEKEKDSLTPHGQQLLGLLLLELQR